MTKPVVLSEVWRGNFLESVHYGHAVICASDGRVLKSWGNPSEIVLPRSSIKMVQAIPLITSGAADHFNLRPEHLALACASHQGAKIHTASVTKWLDCIGKKEIDLRCGPQFPNDSETRNFMLKAAKKPNQIHNNCSGKHAGFLTIAKHLKAGPEYIDPDHPVQKSCLEALEMTMDGKSPGYAIDGCSAPNFAARLSQIARSMAWFASAANRNDAPSKAAERLVTAMSLHPDLVAGKDRACTELMIAMNGKAVIKTGAEAFFTGIIPTRQLGLALKIVDGTRRGSECAIAALLCTLGLLSPKHPFVRKRMNAPIVNWRGIKTGIIKPSADLLRL